LENDAIFWEKVSTSGQRIYRVPTSGLRMLFKCQKFQPSGWKCILHLNLATENLAIIEYSRLAFSTGRNEYIPKFNVPLILPPAVTWLLAYLHSIKEHN
jgi:hypothetical protein